MAHTQLGLAQDERPARKTLGLTTYTLNHSSPPHQPPAWTLAQSPMERLLERRVSTCAVAQAQECVWSTEDSSVEVSARKVLVCAALWTHEVCLCTIYVFACFKDRDDVCMCSEAFYASMPETVMGTWTYTSVDISNATICYKTKRNWSHRQTRVTTNKLL